MEHKKLIAKRSYLINALSWKRWVLAVFWNLTPRSVLIWPIVHELVLKQLLYLSPLINMDVIWCRFFQLENVFSYNRIFQKAELIQLFMHLNALIFKWRKKSAKIIVRFSLLWTAFDILQFCSQIRIGFLFSHIMYTHVKIDHWTEISDSLLWELINKACFEDQKNKIN